MYIIPKAVRKIIGWPAIKRTDMAKHTKVDMFSTVTNSSIGRYSYIGEHTSVFNTTIGVGCSISSYCSIGGGSHPLHWVSTSPIFNDSVSILHYRMANTQYEPFKETKIGNDVWIGTNSIIKAGVSIMDGAVIGMGSVVTKNVGPYEIWAGNPAHCLRLRFSEDVIEKLLKIAWWNWPDKKIQKHACLYNDIDEFIKRFDK